MTKTKSFLALILIICMAFTGFILSGCDRQKFPEASRDPEKNPLPTLEIEMTAESGDAVVLKTSYGYVRYPKAFVDFITVEAVDHSGSSELKFYANIENMTYPIYTIHYNMDEGIPCGRYRVSATTDEVVISVTFHDVPEDISESWVSTFNATQETFNDVLESIAEDARFTGIE